jgi:hypothetical protein
MCYPLFLRHKQQAFSCNPVRLLNKEEHAPLANADADVKQLLLQRTSPWFTQLPESKH